MDKIRNAQQKIAIVTVNYNKSESVAGLVESLESSKYKNFKFYVVDNNSKDTMQLTNILGASRLDWKLIHNSENVGWGMALNLAFSKYIEESLVLVINNDTRIQPETIGELVKTMEENQMVGICGVKILHPDGSLATTGGRIDWLTRLTGITRENKARRSAQETVILNKNEFVDDCCWIIRSEIMNYVQYPPHLFLYFEELWIIDGARKFGYDIAYNPKAIIYHT